MEFKEYQDFVEGTKVYPEPHSIVYPTLGLTGEAGEVADKVKKWLRGDYEMNEITKAELVKECGDCLWYLSSLAKDLGYTLEEVAQNNITKLSSRKQRGVLKGNGDNR